MARTSTSTYLNGQVILEITELPRDRVVTVHGSHPLQEFIEHSISREYASGILEDFGAYIEALVDFEEASRRYLAAKEEADCQPADPERAGPNVPGLKWIWGLFSDNPESKLQGLYQNVHRQFKRMDKALWMGFGISAGPDFEAMFGIVEGMMKQEQKSSSPEPLK